MCDRAQGGNAHCIIGKKTKIRRVGTRGRAGATTPNPWFEDFAAKPTPAYGERPWEAAWRGIHARELTRSPSSQLDWPRLLIKLNNRRSSDDHPFLPDIKESTDGGLCTIQWNRE